MQMLLQRNYSHVLPPACPTQTAQNVPKNVLVGENVSDLDNSQVRFIIYGKVRKMSGKLGPDINV